jgi:hypothetical protein
MESSEIEWCLTPIEERLHLRVETLAIPSFKVVIHITTIDFLISNTVRIPFLILRHTFENLFGSDGKSIWASSRFIFFCFIEIDFLELEIDKLK